MRRVRPMRSAVVILAVLGLNACATKGDVRTLQSDMLRMQQHQDSVLLEIQRQNRLLLDSIRQTMALTVDARGTTANQLRQFDQSVSRLGELVGQIMGTLNRIEQRISTLEQRPVAMPGGGTAPGGGSADQYYSTGMQLLAAGSYATARMAFQELLREFPEHERAPDAQFQLGETYYHQEQWSEAWEALEQVAARWPEAARAPAALFRAGVIAQEQRDFARARTYYTRVRQDYPRSDEARQAQQRLQALPGR